MKRRRNDRGILLRRAVQEAASQGGAVFLLEDPDMEMDLEGALNLLARHQRASAHQGHWRDAGLPLRGEIERLAEADDGGVLWIEWAENGHVWMSGPATTSFEGSFELEVLA